MEKKNWKPYVLWIALTEGLGLLFALLIKNGTELYRSTTVKPLLSPPAVVFPIVWTILYLLMGIGMARVMIATKPHERRGCVGVYTIQLVFNYLWSIWFFNLRAFGFAFFWLIGLFALLLGMIAAFAKVDKPAAAMQLPYLVWTAFAGYLNAGVWLLNR